MARASGWAGTWEGQCGLALPKPNCIFPAAGIGCFRVGWGLCQAGRSCSGPARARRLPQVCASSPEVPSSTPRLGCLELAPRLPCTRPAMGGSAPLCPSQGLSGSGRALQVLFSVAPSLASIPVLWGSPGCCGVLGGGQHCCSHPCLFARGQPKVEGKGVLVHFGRHTWWKQWSTRLPNCPALQHGHPALRSRAGRAMSSASCEERGPAGELIPLLPAGQSRGGLGGSLYHTPVSPSVCQCCSVSHLAPVPPLLPTEPRVPAVLWPCLAPLCRGL